MHINHPCEVAVSDVSPDYETAWTSKEHGIGCSSKKYRPGRTTKSLKGFFDNNHVPTCFQHKHLIPQEIKHRWKKKAKALKAVPHGQGLSAPPPPFYPPHAANADIQKEMGRSGWHTAALPARGLPIASQKIS